MANLNRPIGELIPGNPQMMTASESDSMVEIAKRMEGNGSREHLSQIPLKPKSTEGMRLQQRNGR